MQQGHGWQPRTSQENAGGHDRSFSNPTRIRLTRRVRVALGVLPEPTRTPLNVIELISHGPVNVRFCPDATTRLLAHWVNVRHCATSSQ